ncbi:MAG: AraC family transcriptional regulator [Oscillospiraceae bacterium]|nr:AraC family transcriptional regulator [Oscillospiraceae bacterium]
MLDRSEIGKRGYLREDYRLFHLRDSRAVKLDYHYHEFDKLVFHLSGNTEYKIEGKSYRLQPLDILLVGRSMIHLPVIGANRVYERMVLWINRDFLSRHSTGDTDLAACFTLAARQDFHLCRPRGEACEQYRALFGRIRDASSSTEFGADLMADTCVVQLMIALNRDMLSPPEEGVSRSDPKMEEVTQYIRGHLNEELSIDRLSRTFYLSRYYLMHRFKAACGCTVHQYIRQKRIQQAAERIREGVPVLKAAEEAGFGDYSVFLRAFRSVYGCSPREQKQQ